MKAVRKAAIATNWTRAMVAAAVGYPSVYGTVEDMNRIDTWQYDAPAPSSFSVTFRNGRVVEYSPPGELP